LFKRLLPKASEAPSYQAVFETTTLPEEPNDKQRTLGAIRYLHLQSTAWGQAFPPDLLAQVKTETPETWEAARAAYFLKKLRESENVAPEWKAIGDLLKARKKTVGVLLRSKKNIPEWVRVFRKFGFVTEAWSGGSFFEKPEIVDLYLLLRFLADREDTWALVGVLRSPWVNLSDAALALLKNALDADALAGHRNSWFGFLHSGNWKQTALDEIDHKALEHALSWMEKASSEIRFRRCSDVLLELINHVAPEAGYDDEEQARRNLLQAVNAVREQENAGRSSVFEIAEFFRLNRENASDVAETPSGDEAEVYIMTIHKSKGLEFPLVILGEPGPKAGGGLALDITPIDAPFDDGNQRDIRLVLAVTPDESAESEDQRNYRSLLLNRVRQLNKNRELAEVVRLFYVAVTRAESHFMLINHENWDRNSSEAFLKLWLPVSNEVLEEAGITKMGDFLSAGDVVFSPDEAAAILPMLEHPEMELTKPFDASIRQEVVQTLERLHINSAFAHRKPRKVTEVIRAEGAPMVEYAPDDFETGEDAEAPRYRGTIVHKLLEWMAAGAEPDAGLVERAALVTGLPAGDPGEAVRQAGAAWKALSKRFPGARRFVTEHAFLADLGSETGLLNGVADLLVEDAKGDWWLVDYKTSALHSGFTEHAEKAGYLKQLDVYAEAYKRLFNLEIPPARRLLLFTFPEEPVFINAE
jgi:ATP-dependent helicase/nuclease subunit A